jgi:PAS domain S-box-containing protein
MREPENTKEQLLRQIDEMRLQIEALEAWKNEHQETKKSLQAEFDFCSAVLNTAGALVVVLDRQGRIVRMNRACEQTTGRSSDEVRDKHVWDLFLITEEVEPVKQVFRQLRSGQFPNQHENYWVTKDGRKRLIAWSNTALLDHEGSVQYVIGTGLDITERREAEQALAASERNYREIFNAANEMIVVHDPHTGEVVDANSTWCETFGYSPQEARRLSIGDFSLGEAPYGQDDAVRWVRKAIEEGPQLFEWLCKKKNGELFWVEVNLKRAVIGDAERVLAVVRDITERKESQEALRKAHDELEQRVRQRTAELGDANRALRREVEERAKAEQAVRASRSFLQTVMDAIPEVMMVIDRDYRILLANRAARELADEKALASGCLTCHQVSHHRTIPCEGTTEPCPLAEVVAAKAPVTVTHTHYDGDGNAAFVEIRAAPIFDETGEVIQIIESCRDITERVQAAEALRESEQRFRSLVETTSDWIWAVDHSGIYTYASPKVEELLGYSPEELIGKMPIDLVVPEETERLDGIFRDVMASHAQFVRLEKTTFHKAGHRVVLEMSGVPIFDGDGRLQGYRGVDRDITRRKETEAALQRTMAKLEQSNRDLAEFAYNASHDLQEPLRVVNTYLQALEELSGDRLEEQSLSFISLSRDTTKRMQRLISDLLAYAHVGTRKKHFELVDANRVVDQVMTDLESTIRQTDAEVVRDELPTVMTDVTLMTQLFQNLVANAIKFHSHEPPRVHISAERSGEDWVFSVSDNGIGIDPKYVGRIFSVFERLHSSDTYPGSGIGLAICKRVVERHNGRIWCESEPGKGTTFRFSIPLEQRDEP